MSEIKQQLRKQIRERIMCMSEEERERWSGQIAGRLYELNEWQHAHTIGITISVDEEVSTYEMIERAWQEGKRVAAPKCDRLSRTMTFREIRSWDDLEKVYMNLREPIPARTKEISADEIELLIMPGIAFTEKGDRLGYGGGYYDRFLPHYSGHTIALAYSAQLVPSIPMDEHDKRVQKIVTESQVYSSL